MGVVVIEVSEEEIDMGPVEIRPITPAMEQVIQEALQSEKGKKLADDYNAFIFVRDLRPFVADPTSRESWLNDEVINFYMGMIGRRSEETDLPKVFPFSTIFFPAFDHGGHAIITSSSSSHRLWHWLS